MNAMDRWITDYPEPEETLYDWYDPSDAEVSTWQSMYQDFLQNCIDVAKCDVTEDNAEDFIEIMKEAIGI